jgi:hypothetical protein
MPSFGGLLKVVAFAFAAPPPDDSRPMLAM